MTNILQAIATIINHPIPDLLSYYKSQSNNRINALGDALEYFVKDAFANTIDEPEISNKLEKYSELFSWSGNQNNPPDLIIRNGDAIEVKKIQTSSLQIPLNSSYPKSKLFSNNPQIASACRKCETWTEKDIVYAIGATSADKTKQTLKRLWLIYGDCYAASKEYYERIRDQIATGINAIPDVEFSKTRELGRVNKVDPLGITYLRIRGMWGINNPSISNTKGKDIMNIISLFAGCGGLDLGFRLAGFNPVWANEYDRTIWDTYEFNHPETILDRRDIRKINSAEIPDCIGIIGGPPCQSWSAAGAKRGIDDSRGQLFWDYIRIVRDKQPLFFLAENVSGILAPRNQDAFTYILSQFQQIGYRVSFKLLNAKSFRVPQDRKRVIVVGYRENLGFGFEFPQPGDGVLTLRDAIFDLRAVPPIPVKGKLDNYHPLIRNHECADLGFSSLYMSRNRVRSWSEPSFTIQASGRHAPLHPQASKMILVGQDKRIFDPNSPQPYRRLSVRECARVQTFPDEFMFKYKQIADGYKMVGNAVPVNLARMLASKIFADISTL